MSRDVQDLQRQQSIRSHIDLQVKQTSARQTVDSSFGAVMKRGVAGTLNKAAQVVSPFSPSASAVLSAAVSGLGTAEHASSTMAGNAAVVGGGGLGVVSTGSGIVGGTGAAGGTYMNAVAGRAASGDMSAQMMMATREMQELNQQFNLQYLMMQQKVQGENRQFTALSNIMKTKHDTAKNALNNLK